MTKLFVAVDAYGCGNGDVYIIKADNLKEAEEKAEKQFNKWTWVDEVKFGEDDLGPDFAWAISY